MHHEFQKFTITALPARSARVERFSPSSVLTVELRRRLAGELALVCASARGSLPTWRREHDRERHDHDDGDAQRDPARGCFTPSPPRARRLSGRSSRPRARRPCGRDLRCGIERDRGAERDERAADPDPHDHRVHGDAERDAAALVRRRHEREVDVARAARCAPTACRCPSVLPGKVEIAGAYTPRSSPPCSMRTLAFTVFFWSPRRARCPRYVTR